MLPIKYIFTFTPTYFVSIKCSTFRVLKIKIGCETSKYIVFLLLSQQVHIKLYVWYFNIKKYREPKGNVFVYSKFPHTEKALVGFPL